MNTLNSDDNIIGSLREYAILKDTYLSAVLEGFVVRSMVVLEHWDPH